MAGHLWRMAGAHNRFESDPRNHAASDSVKHREHLESVGRCADQPLVAPGGCGVRAADLSAGRSAPVATDRTPEHGPCGKRHGCQHLANRVAAAAAQRAQHHPGHDAGGDSLARADAQSRTGDHRDPGVGGTRDESAGRSILVVAGRTRTTGGAASPRALSPGPPTHPDNRYPGDDHSTSVPQRIATTRPHRPRLAVHGVLAPDILAAVTSTPGAVTPAHGAFSRPTMAGERKISKLAGPIDPADYGVDRTRRLPQLGLDHFLVLANPGERADRLAGPAGAARGSDSVFKKLCHRSRQLRVALDSGNHRAAALDPASLAVFRHRPVALSLAERVHHVRMAHSAIGRRADLARLRGVVRPRLSAGGTHSERLRRRPDPPCPTTDRADPPRHRAANSIAQATTGCRLVAVRATRLIDRANRWDRLVAGPLDVGV